MKESGGPGGEGWRRTMVVKRRRVEEKEEGESDGGRVLAADEDAYLLKQNS